MDTSTASSNARRLSAAVLFVAALAIYLPSIGVGDFVGDDEALDAGVVAEMARTGDWLFPEFNGEYLPPKPPLFYLLARAVSVARGGVDEASLRIPSAVAGALLVALTAHATAATRGTMAGTLAGLLLLTMPVMHDQARAGRCDMLLALLVSACLFLARDGWVSARRRWLFAALLGLAAITKGGVGPGIVGVTLLGAAAADRSFRPLRVFVDPAMAALVIVGGTWYLVGALHWGARFVDEQIVGENLNHLIGGTAISDRDPGTRSIGYHLGYYPRNLFVTMLPWSLLLPFVVVEAWRRGSLDAEQRLLFAWIAASVVFLTTAARKSPYYMLPLAPAVAALVAGWLAPRIEQAVAARPLQWPLRPKVVVSLLGAAVLLWLTATHLPLAGCPAEALAAALYDHPLSAIPSIWLGGLAIIGFGLAVRDRHWAIGSIAMISALASLWLLADQVEGRIADCGSLKTFAREVATIAPGDHPLFFFRDPLPAVALYAERRIPTLRQSGDAAPNAPFALIVPESLREEVPKDWLAASRVLASGRGRVFTRRPMGIELLEISKAPG